MDFIICDHNFPKYSHIYGHAEFNKKQTTHETKYNVATSTVVKGYYTSSDWQGAGIYVYVAIYSRLLS